MPSNQDLHDVPVPEDKEIYINRHVTFEAVVSFMREKTKGNQEDDAETTSATTPLSSSKKGKMPPLFEKVRPRYMDMSRSTTYIRNRNEQLQRRRELERSNSLRANERKEQWRAMMQLKQDQEQTYRKWMQESNAEEHRLRAESTTKSKLSKGYSSTK
ncbi:Aste57867_22085 [Aphanomyces stellatus]|uniref:Aste57867_22085 protein n=1 Tax=Aphanomyces stellatus TaxID=120398 RepID=A0A485LLA4_9STRA|nr:hypothetical protein As57867_022016 [Aphanomyces stellatus]VFT98753.1 Aste57867_22085 [Aphanomyces stellatus]